MSSDPITSQETELEGIEVLPEHRDPSRRIFKTVHEIRSQYKIVTQERFGLSGMVVIGLFVLLGLIGPFITPYDPQTQFYTTSGDLIRSAGPSAAHPFGTTSLGRDVFSQALVSARVSVIIGLVAATFSVIIGTAVGVVSAYYGGWVDDVLMRFTDIMYGIPFLPFIVAMVLIGGAEMFTIIMSISLILWRSTARVVRSQILTIKERPYIEAAHAVGVSDTRVILRHLVPNVLPLITLYGAFNVATAILTEASIAFLGFGDPTRISWGKMLYQAYTAGAIRTAWWWVIPPGVAITLLVVGVFMLARAYEAVTNPDLQEVPEA